MNNETNTDVTELTPGREISQPPMMRQKFSLTPRNLAEAMDFAKMMADSDLVPKNYRGKPGDVLIAVQMGNEVGLAPMAAIQNIATINGKPGLYGDAGKAILLANGCIIEEDDTAIVQANGRARCKITRRGRPPVERTFSIEDAKAANLWNKEGPWRSYAYRQMAWRAFWFAARDAAADLLKGLGGAEELADIVYTTTGEITSRISSKPELPPYTEDTYAIDMPQMQGAINAGKATPQKLLAMLSTKYVVGDDFANLIRELKPIEVDDSFVDDMNKAEAEHQLGD